MEIVCCGNALRITAEMISIVINFIAFDQLYMCADGTLIL